MKLQPRVNSVNLSEHAFKPDHYTHPQTTTHRYALSHAYITTHEFMQKGTEIFVPSHCHTHIHKHTPCIGLFAMQLLRIEIRKTVRHRTGDTVRLNLELRQLYIHQSTFSQFSWLKIAKRCLIFVYHGHFAHMRTHTRTNCMLSTSFVQNILFFYNQLTVSVVEESSITNTNLLQFVIKLRLLPLSWKHNLPHSSEETQFAKFWIALCAFSSVTTCIVILALLLKQPADWEAWSIFMLWITHGCHFSQPILYVCLPCYLCSALISSQFLSWSPFCVSFILESTNVLFISIMCFLLPVSN